jgi:hypothetical protein
MDEQIFRVNIPALVDVRTTSIEQAIQEAIGKIVAAGFGLGSGKVQVNYETVDHVEES